MKRMRFAVEKDGFYGVSYPPAEDAFPGKVLIVPGGDGSFAATKRIAKKFVNGGLTAVAVAYWKRRGLPTVPEHIPSRVFQSDFGDRFMYRHSMKAPQEMRRLHEQLYSYLETLKG